jgi:hypothetical protein
MEKAAPGGNNADTATRGFKKAARNFIRTISWIVEIVRRDQPRPDLNFFRPRYCTSLSLV